MPTAKHRKNHKQKAQARKIKVEEAKKKYQKMQKDLLMKLIDQEKQLGMFDNLPSINLPNLNTDAPQLDISGPSI